MELWQIILLARIITAYVAAPVFLKKIAGLNNFRKFFWWQFFFCLIFSSFYSFYFGLIFNSTFFIVGTIGFFNSLASFSQWRAISISLSKTSLFAQLSGLITIILGYLFLGEIKFLNTKLSIGLCLYFIGIILLLYDKKKKGKINKINFNLLKLIITYSIIWGVAGFFIRYLALENVPFSEFLVGWYGGSALGAFLIFIFSRQERIDWKINFKETRAIIILAFFIWVSMLLEYWLAGLAPITVYQPIFLVSETVIPSIVGLVIFKEIKEFSFLGKGAFSIILVGTVLIALSY